MTVKTQKFANEYARYLRKKKQLSEICKIKQVGRTLHPNYEKHHYENQAKQPGHPPGHACHPDNTFGRQEGSNTRI